MTAEPQDDSIPTGPAGEADHPATEDGLTTGRRSDAGAWARPVDRLTVTDAGRGLAATVSGRRVSGPLQGFGQMWQKTFRVRLPTDTQLTPEEVVAAWKDEFPAFWPKGNTFYAPLAGIRPGEVALLSVSAAGPVKLHTGVMVMFADAEAFTLMTPEGHMLAAWITFSAFRDAEDRIVVQAQALERTSDPFFELGYVLGGNRMNDRFWQATLENVGRRFTGSDGDVDVETEIVCVDRRRQWRYARNVRYNAGMRAALHAVSAPLRRMRPRHEQGHPADDA